MKAIIYIALVVALILLVPLVAMQFTDEVVWDLTDFIVAGVLLFGTGLLLVFSMKKIRTTSYRVIVGILIAVVFLLTWVELAVGIFGTPWAGS